MSTVRTEKELAESLKRGESTITIEGDICEKVIRIKATGRVAWLVAIGAIAVTAKSLLADVATGGTALPVTVPVKAFTGTAAVGILGLSTTTSAVLIAVAAGGVGVLNSLRDYNIVEKNSNRVVLKK